MSDDLSKFKKKLTANEKFLFLFTLRVCSPCLRPMENSPNSPVFLKVKKTQEMSQPSQNGECTEQRIEKRRKHSSYEQPPKRSFSDAAGSETKESSSLTFSEEDPERMKHSKITALLP